MNCIICGSEVNQGEMFCPVCGSELQDSATEQGDSGGNQDPAVSGNMNPEIPQVPGLKTPYGSSTATSGATPPGEVPTSERPTTRVTVTGDTDELAGTKVDPLIKLKTGGDKTRYRVKARPKHLGLKNGLLIMLLAGIGVGVFFGIRYLKELMDHSAKWKSFRSDQVDKTADNADYVCGQILLTAKPDVSEKQVKKLAEEKKGTIVGKIPVTNDYQIEFEDRMMKEKDLKAIIEEWKQRDKIVASAQLHYAYGTEGGFRYSDNPWRDDNNTGDPYGEDLEWDVYHPAGNNWAVESIWAPMVWDSLESGAEYQQVEVGIVDTVFDTTHRDLTDRFAPLKHGDSEAEENDTDNTDTLVEGNPADVSGDYARYAGTYKSGGVDLDEKRLMHGTHMAGIIAANMDDDFGMTGVAQNAKLHGYAMAGDYDSEDQKTYSSVFEWKYALSRMMENDIRLINVSMQVDVSDTSETTMTEINADMDRFLQACISEGYDFLLVKSAGDRKLQDLSDTFLAGIGTEEVRDRIVVVGGAKCEYNDSGELKGYVKTNSTNYGKRIDIYAPGPNVLSDIPGDRTEKRSGTSGSAAFVTGACSLVMGILPKATMSEVRNIVLNSYYDTVTVTVQLNGRDRKYVRGYLNVYWATEAAKKSNLNQDDTDANGAENSEIFVEGKTFEEWMTGNRPERQEEETTEENTTEQPVNKDWIDGYLRFFDETIADGTTFYDAGVGSFSKARILYINEDEVPEFVVLLEPSDSVMVATWNDVDKKVEYIILEKHDPQYLIQIKEGTNLIGYSYEYIKTETFLGYTISKKSRYVVEYFQIYDGKILSIEREDFGSLEEAADYSELMENGDDTLDSVFGLKSIKPEYADWNYQENYTLNSIKELTNWIKEQ